MAGWTTGVARGSAGGTVEAVGVDGWALVPAGGDSVAVVVFPWLAFASLTSSKRQYNLIPVFTLRLPLTAFRNPLKWSMNLFVKLSGL